jgi:hypothetical protein
MAHSAQLFSAVVVAGRIAGYEAGLILRIENVRIGAGYVAAGGHMWSPLRLHTPCGRVYLAVARYAAPIAVQGAAVP